MGHRVLVLEKKSRLDEPVCCTGIIGRECIDAFAIDKSVILGWANSASVFSPSGNLLRLQRPEPQAAIVDRPAFNQAMAQQSQDRGAEYLLDCPVTGIEVTGDGVRISVNQPGKGPISFEGRAVVIATGFSPKLNEALGLGRFGDFAVGAQAVVTTAGINEVEVFMSREIAPAFFAWLVPLSPRTALAGLLSRRNTGLYLRKFLANLLAQGKIASSEVEFSYGGISLQPLSRTYGDRLLVVGTAAGQVKPTSGGGIYYGLLCADIAADNLHRALETNLLAARSLAQYQRQWRKRLGQEIRLGYWARKLYERLSDAQINQILDIIKANGIEQGLLQADDISFDWHGKAIMKLVGHQALAKALDMVKSPLLAGRSPKRDNE